MLITDFKTIHIHSVTGSESGSCGFIKPHIILNIFQDIAEKSANSLNFGLQKLQEQGLSWYLLNYHIKINNYPKYNDNIHFQTWPCTTIKGLKAVREFLVTNSDGEIIIMASSAWLLVDLKTKRPVKLEKVSYKTFSQRVLESEFEKISDITDITNQKSFDVLYSEIDINKHVNNSIYFVWALETIPPDIFTQYYPAEIEISFKSNVNYGDKVNSICQIINNKDKLVSLHKLNQEDTEKELVRIRLKWSKF